jgi:hypothetical protein
LSGSFRSAIFEASAVTSAVPPALVIRSFSAFIMSELVRLIMPQAFRVRPASWRAFSKYRWMPWCVANARRNCACATGEAVAVAVAVAGSEARTAKLSNWLPEQSSIARIASTRAAPSVVSP